MGGATQSTRVPLTSPTTGASLEHRCAQTGAACGAHGATPPSSSVFLSIALSQLVEQHQFYCRCCCRGCCYIGKLQASQWVCERCGSLIVENVDRRIKADMLKIRPVVRELNLCQRSTSQSS